MAFQELKALAVGNPSSLTGALSELKSKLPSGDVGRIINSYIFNNHEDSINYQKIFRQQLLRDNNLSLKNIISEIVKPNNDLETIFLVFRESNIVILDFLENYEHPHVDRIPELEEPELEDPELEEPVIHESKIRKFDIYLFRQELMIMAVIATVLCFVEIASSYVSNFSYKYCLRVIEIYCGLFIFIELLWILITLFTIFIVKSTYEY